MTDNINFYVPGTNFKTKQIADEAHWQSFEQATHAAMRAKFDQGREEMDHLAAVAQSKGIEEEQVIDITSLVNQARLGNEKIRLATEDSKIEIPGQNPLGILYRHSIGLLQEGRSLEQVIDFAAGHFMQLISSIALFSLRHTNAGSLSRTPATQT